MNTFKSLLTMLLFAAAFAVPAFAQQSGSLSGQVADAFGSIIQGATVTVTAADGTAKTATTDEQGQYTITGLAPGKYTVTVAAETFAVYEHPDMEIKAGRRETLNVPMSIEDVAAEVEVSDDQISTDPNSNLSATVLSEKELDALPDDPDQLEQALQALAGPSAGPNGGQIYIDGFSGGELPPKESIREVRINNNPFSAEFDRLGFGRIEILTRPGTDRWRGSAMARFNDESLNSRNPFAANRAASQMRAFGGNISGPIQKGKSSFFLSVNQSTEDANSVLNAVVLDSALNPVNIQQEFQNPSTRLSISPRFDYAINENNTLVFRYNFSNRKRENQGIGGTSLAERAYDSTGTNHDFRITETMIINPTTVNETRFEFEWNKSEQNGDNTIPTINVSDAFTSGGASIGNSFDDEKEWELQNYTTTSLGSALEHTIKFGVKAQGVYLTDHTENNLAGTFTFSGAPAVTSPEGCSPVEPGCTIISEAVSPLEQYRQRLLGNPGARFFPTQFTLATGDPEAKVSRIDYGIFALDDWRINPGLTLSFGLRYENQTNISDNTNFAPRFSFAWSPGAGSGNPKTVIRGGFGVFYDRFSESLTLNSLRTLEGGRINLILNGNDPAAVALLQQAVFTPTGVTNVPTAEQILAAFPQSNTLQYVSPDMKSPTTYQGMIGVERSLPGNSSASLFFVTAQTNNVLRSLNINAPVCADVFDCSDGVRPDPTSGDIYQYESTGTSRTNQLIANFRTSIIPRISIFGNYRFGLSKSDADGAGSFPAYTYDLSGEYGRASGDVRHYLTLVGNIQLPWDISLNPFVIARSGSAFNITRGLDLNNDGRYTERPTFAELGARCTELNLNNSWCDVSGFDPDAVIPRNYGTSPGYFSVNMRVSKNFGFGSSESAGGGAAAGGGRGGRGGRMGRFGGFGGGRERKPYNLNIGLNINNLLNTVNYGAPVSSLNSGRFGEFTSTGGGWGRGGGSGTANRRIELSARFSW